MFPHIGNGKEELAEKASLSTSRNRYPDPVGDAPSTCTACSEDCAADAGSDSITAAKEFTDYIPFYVNNRKNIKYCHLNINSLRHKFEPLGNVLRENLIDVLSLQETKVDDSFPRSQFHVPGFKFYRKDVSSWSGGLIM